jgi:hypothetical protein
MQKFLLRIFGAVPNGSKLRLTSLLLVVFSFLFVSGAEGALVRVGRLVLQADGGFTPRTLPRRTYAPIDFRGHADLSSTDSRPVPALLQTRLDFDRDGRLNTAGLPVCEPAEIEGATPAAAQRHCAAALVGSGHIEAVVSLPGSSPLTVRSPLSLFNGPRLNGNPTVVAHAQVTAPALETYVVVVPIERRSGGTYAYRATIDVPEIAGGSGALTHVDAKIGRSYRSGGSKRGYISARCADGILQTRGRFSFDDGTIIEGSVFKPCSVRP